MNKKIIMLGLTFLALLPIAIADSHDPSSADPETVTPVPQPVKVIGQGKGLYIVLDGYSDLPSDPATTVDRLSVQLWEETNGVNGLQREAYEYAPGRLQVPDTQHFALL